MIISKYRKKVDTYLAAQCATPEGFDRACMFTVILQAIGSVVVYGALILFLK